MKLNKKFLSCFMAATMMVSPATVFAADTVNVASGTVNGSGTVHYVNTQVYNIILPTDEALDFHIDPYGLLSMTSDKMSVSDALSNAAAASTNITSSATAVINKSSVDVNVAIEAMVHNSNTATPVDPTKASAAAVKLVDDPSEVMNASDASYAGVYLAITPISGASITSHTSGPASNVADLTLDATSVANKVVTGSVYTLSDVAFDLTNSTDLTEDAYAITSNGDTANPTQFNFNLSGMPEAYEITSTGSIAVLNENTAANILGTVASAAAVSFMFNISGKVDYNSPVWQEFDPTQNVNGQQKIGLQVKFIITKAVKDEEIKDGDTITVNNGDTSLAFKVKLPDGATGVQSVSCVTGGKTYNLTGTFNNNSITLNDSNVNWFLSNSGTYPMTIKFNGSTTVYTLTLTVQ